MKHFAKYLAAPALFVMTFAFSGTVADPMATFDPSSGCALATPVPPGSENPSPPDYPGGPCVDQSGIGLSDAGQAVDLDTPGCLTCDEARQLKENQAAAGVFGAGVGAAIVGLATLGINYSATLVSRAMEDAGC